MKLITLYLPEYYIKYLDQLVEEKIYPNRAKAIRFAIRDLISNESIFFRKITPDVSAAIQKDIQKKYPKEEKIET